jgi:hypothetical protein
MDTHDLAESRSSSVGGILAWLGGGHWGELRERHERSSHAVAGVIVLLGAVLAWLVGTTAVSQSARWPLLAVTPVTLVLGLLVGAVTRGIAGGSDRGRPGTAGRAAVAVAVGVIVGELAALVVFSGAIDRRLDERALRAADTAPAVAQASESLQQTRVARAGLDAAVEQARANQDKALIVARCEYNPTPDCPQTRITGVPGTGPETRTANEQLSDAQRELANALAGRDRQAPALDVAISRQEQQVADARRGALTGAGAGLGTRWMVMNDVTLAGGGALALRLLTIALFVFVYLLPLILRRWRGETTHDRDATARAERERADVDAETAIAVKRAEIRREAEILWAEHQLTQARMAIEAQAEIDREQQRRRVAAALEAPAETTSRRVFEPAGDGIFLPIAAEAEAASRAITQMPSGATDATAQPPRPTQNLPAPVEPRGEVEPHQEPAAPLIPSIPDVTRAAARWIRPFVPPVLGRMIDTTTAPLRSARQVFEEVEEITFSLRRSRRVTVDSETSETQERPRHQTAPAEPEDRSQRAHRRVSGHRQHPPVPLSATEIDGLSLTEGDVTLELIERDGPRELRSSQGPRQLPPGK